MENDPNNANAPATKADLAEAVAATKGEFKELFNTQKEEMERLLADQANVILEAVDERMDKKLNEKFDPVMTKLDGIRRALIETVFSVAKRKLSCRAPGRCLLTQRRQALLLGLTYNLYRL